MKVHVHLEFEDAGQAADALARLRGDTVQITSQDARATAGASPVIAAEDNPAVGFPPEPPVSVAPPAPAVLGFGQGVALPPGAIPVPSSAVAAAPQTAPAAPSFTAPTPPATQAPALPTAPAATAPPAPATPTAPAPAAAPPGLDTKGLPWDPRIHASTKTTNADGSWRDKRNTPADFKAQVEAELRAALALNAAAAQLQPAGGAPLPPSATAAAVPAPPAPPSAVAGSAPAASPIEWTFPKLMEALAPKMMSGQLSADAVGLILGKHGLTAVGQLALTPNLIPAIAADFGL